MKTSAQRPTSAVLPNFKSTIDGTQIELSKLNGKILRFELFATDFHFKKQEIQELDEKINALKIKCH
jgi:hypothetical protein